MAEAVKDGSHSRTKAAVPAADRRKGGGVCLGRRPPGDAFSGLSVRPPCGGKGVIYREGSTDRTEPDRTVPPEILRSGAAALRAAAAAARRSGADVTGAPLRSGNAPFVRGSGGYGGQTGPKIEKAIN